MLCLIKGTFLKVQFNNNQKKSIAVPNSNEKKQPQNDLRKTIRLSSNVELLGCFQVEGKKNEELQKVTVLLMSYRAVRIKQVVLQTLSLVGSSNSELTHIGAS